MKRSTGEGEKGERLGGRSREEGSCGADGSTGKRVGGVIAACGEKSSSGVAVWREPTCGGVWRRRRRRHQAGWAAR